jgi:subtilisin family serine protease
MKRKRKTSAATQTSRTRKRRHTPQNPIVTERVAAAQPDQLISFAVLCRPRSGATLAEFTRVLSLKTIRELQPDEETVRQVKKQLWQLGFEVFDLPGPVVSGRSRVDRFTEVFQVQIVARTTETRVPESREVLRETTLELADGDAVLAPPALPNALMVTVSVKPTLTTPRVPAEFPGRNLHLPGDIAQLMGAAAVHRNPLPNGDRATGSGVTVAVIDSGFAEHPYYAEHGYRIMRIAASDQVNPSQDGGKHGTVMLAGVLACAPDVQVLAMKYNDALLGIKEAVYHSSAPKIVSISWGFPIAANRKQLPTIPINLVVYAAEILTMIADGITFVAAAGNLGQRNFPAMMPEVIAVGGIELDDDDTLMAHVGSSSFTTKIYPGRNVPDICGLAGEAVLPTVTSAGGFIWTARAGYTSLATAQVAGVAALLLQKKPALLPVDVRDRLVGTATAIAVNDPATGAGLVNAFDAWSTLN